MARCSNDAVFAKVIEKKLENRTEVHLSLHKELPDCRNIKADDYYSISGTPYWSRFDKPANAFECFPKDCTTTGTLQIVNEGGVAKVTYYIPDPSVDWANGVITFYIRNAVNGIYKLIIGDPSTGAQYSLADLIPSTIEPNAFYPMFVDLSTMTPTQGSFTPSDAGAFITIEAPSGELEISTISVFDSIYDFEIDDTVILSCLSSIGGSIDLEMIESTCMEKGHQSDPTSFEYPVTAKAVTTNEWKLNPLNKKGDAVEGFEPHTIKTTIGQDGAVSIFDMADDCGFIAAQLVDCNPFDGELKRVSVPVAISLDEDQYQVLDNEGVKIFRFNSALANREVYISYPRITHVDRIVGTNDELNTVRTRMSVPVYYTKAGDNVVLKEIHVYHNVWVTSYPTTITTEETEKSYTFTFMPDENGEWYHIDRIKSYRQTAINAPSGGGDVTPTV